MEDLWHASSQSDKLPQLVPDRGCFDQIYNLMTQGGLLSDCRRWEVAITAHLLPVLLPRLICDFCFAKSILTFYCCSL